MIRVKLPPGRPSAVFPAPYHRRAQEVAAVTPDSEVNRIVTGHAPTLFPGRCRGTRALHHP